MSHTRRIATEDQARIQAESKNWPPLNSRSRKVKCPVCEAAGYVGGSWTWHHLSHWEAPCGRWVAGKAGDRRHAARCKECRK